MDNYFNYFTEIEEHFQKRRGTLLILSTLDWALIETWKDSGVPLEAVLRGIDATFDKWDRKPSKTRKVNGIGFCAQEVLAAAEDMKEAAVGSTPPSGEPKGIDPQEIARFLSKNAAALESSKLPHAVSELAKQDAAALRQLASEITSTSSLNLEDLERRLTVMEEKLQAVLFAGTPDDQLVDIRAQADRELAPYRRNMSAAQIAQLHKQFLNKKLLERYGLPRLSLFYM